MMVAKHSDIHVRDYHINLGLNAQGAQNKKAKHTSQKTPYHQIMGLEMFPIANHQLYTALLLRPLPLLTDTLKNCSILTCAVVVLPVPTLHIK